MRHFCRLCYNHEIFFQTCSHIFDGNQERGHRTTRLSQSISHTHEMQQQVVRLRSTPMCNRYKTTRCASEDFFPAMYVQEKPRKHPCPQKLHSSFNDAAILYYLNKPFAERTLFQFPLRFEKCPHKIFCNMVYGVNHVNLLLTLFLLL